MRYEFSDSSGFLEVQYTDTAKSAVQIGDVLGVYLYGDGSGNEFRFFFDDFGFDHEASPWVKTNWSGWKLVRFNPLTDALTPWLHGDGVIEGPMLLLLGFHLRWQGQLAGSILLDNFARVSSGPSVVDISDCADQIPEGFTLQQNYPNPFNVGTIIDYRVRGDEGKTVPVSLIIFNLVGQRVKTLVEGQQRPGVYRIRWDGTDEKGKLIPSGVYVCRLRVRDLVTMKKIVFQR